MKGLRYFGHFRTPAEAIKHIKFVGEDLMPGDWFYSKRNGEAYIWDGGNWILMLGSTGEPQPIFRKKEGRFMEVYEVNYDLPGNTPMAEVRTIE